MQRKNKNRNKAPELKDRFLEINSWKIDLWNVVDKKKGIYTGVCKDCGKEHKVRIYDVKSGKSKRCKSCAVRLRNYRHKGCGTTLYNRWQGIKSRVGKGIYKDVTICDEWKDNFEAFKEWSLKNGYSEDKVIDKDILCEKKGIYPKVYSPETCLWVTQRENSQQAVRERMNKDELFHKMLSLKQTILHRTYSDEDIEKAKKLIDIDIPYEDILKITNIPNQSTLSNIRAGKIKTIKELQQDIDDIVSSTLKNVAVQNENGLESNESK